MMSVCVKVEEEVEQLNSSDPESHLDSSLNIICVKEEEAEDEDCELCKSFFFNKCEAHGPALFIPDTPVPMGVSERARRTLPAGLEVLQSPIPNAGLGVFNTGDPVPVGAHFGPYQGDVVEREEAMSSGYSWVIHKLGQAEEYIDGRNELNSNWMRYVNCARHDEEQNLVASQYRGGILYRCCRPIQPGQELLVWYDDAYAKDLGVTFSQIWKRKCSGDEPEQRRPRSEVFSCTLCPLSYTAQIYLHKHIRKRHSDLYLRLLTSGQVRPETLKPKQSSTLSYDKKETCQCSECGKSFTHISNLRRHQSIHTGDRPYECSQCGTRFSRHGTLLRHRRTHTAEKPYRCSVCGKNFSDQSTLKKHQRLHTGEKPYLCLACGKGFTQQSHLRHHQWVHTGQKPYHCAQCGKSFTNQGNLKKHQLAHTDTKPHRCSCCGKSFAEKGTLQRHQSVHTRDKPYLCSLCGKSFTDRGDLSKHHRVHTGEKPYYCSLCGKRFTQQSALQLHNRTHTGEKPYRCSYCDKSFTDQGNLKRHRRVHTGEKPYQCAKCGKDFTEQGNLKKHQRVHTGQKLYPCSRCGKSFGEKGSLRRHHAVHTGHKSYQES